MKNKYEVTLSEVKEAHEERGQWIHIDPSFGEYEQEHQNINYLLEVIDELTTELKFLGLSESQINEILEK